MKQHRQRNGQEGIAMIIVVCIMAVLVMMSLAMMPDTFHNMELVQVNAFDTIRAFARGIFIDYVWAFELVSLLLTIVIAGFGLIKFRKGGEWK